MTVGAWLRSRTPPPPPAMLAGVIDALGERAALDAHAAPTACLDAAAALLGALLREDSLGRERASELLVADALVTYAFEAGATSASDLDEFAATVMTRLAGLSSGEADGPDA
jgi:hypothetical protein